MKKYLVLGLCLLGSCGAWASAPTQALSQGTNSTQQNCLFLKGSASVIHEEMNVLPQATETNIDTEPTTECFSGKESMLISGRLGDGQNINIKCNLTINSIHSDTLRTITEIGHYLCTAYLNNGEIEHYHISLESGSLEIPTSWMLETE